MAFLNKLAAKAMAFACGMKQRTEEFMEDERGLSGVVVAVLLILVAVLAVVMIWEFLGDWLETLWLTIIGKSAEIQ
mgnify:CR=1 FL=1